MAESVSNFLRQYFSSEFVIFLVSLLPILELRGGMIAAALFGEPWHKAIIISLIGNMLPVYFVILFIESFLKWMKGVGHLSGIARWIEAKGAKHGAVMAEKYPARLYLGLMLFVAVPLPGTGAWTGALIASVLCLDPKKSGLIICAGVLIAGVIMSVITYVIPDLIRGI
ncbi:MAG: small multi-drug export protein [Clostridiales bacterium]|nr:small multi-drug export protein [Clostridiales bacterium]